MGRSPWLMLVAVLILSVVLLGATASQVITTSSEENPERFGFGTPATAEAIATVDIDVMPDGTGLPAGSGTVASGRELYVPRCAWCHGENGIGGPNDALVPPPATPPGQSRAIGAFWPYATTLFDYVRRTMPYERPGSLSDDEVYSLVAYLLFLNGLWNEEETLNAASLPEVAMPARELFRPDDRLETIRIR